MHDIRALEELGVAAVGVITSEFVDAADIQNKYIGYDPAYVVVGHPIQDRSEDELRALADTAFDALVGSLCATD